MFVLCFGKRDATAIRNKKHLKMQLREEGKGNLKHMFHIGKFKPHEVYCGNDDELDSKDVIAGLCSLCENAIHVSLGFNPTRLILSHVSKSSGVIKKESCFYITNVKNDITDTSHISQYDIYCAIQSYIKTHNEYPYYVNSTDTVVAI